MATETTNLGLKKPDTDDFYNVNDFNYNADVIDESFSDLKKQPIETVSCEIRDGICQAVISDGITVPFAQQALVIKLPEDLPQNAALALNGGASYPICAADGGSAPQGNAAGSYLHLIFNSDQSRWYVMGGGFSRVFIQDSEPAQSNCIWIKPVSRVEGSYTVSKKSTASANGKRHDPAGGIMTDGSASAAVLERNGEPDDV